MRFLIIFLLMTSLCFANGGAILKIKDKNNIEWTALEKEEIIKNGKKVGEKISDKYKDYKIENFSLALNNDGYYEKLVKPNINENQLLTEEESQQVKLGLWNDGLADDMNKVIREGRKLVFAQAKPAKNDYKHDYDKGTFYFISELRNDGTPLLRNYSFSKVIIPNGTTIKECNFSQRNPETEAIVGENLTFIECNLVNVKLDPSWTLQQCNTSQIKRELLSQQDNGDGTTTLIISFKAKNKQGEFEELHKDEETINNNDLPNRLLYFQ